MSKFMKNPKEVAELVKAGGTVFKGEAYVKAPEGQVLVALMIFKRLNLVTVVDDTSIWEFTKSRSQRGWSIEYYLISIEFARQNGLNSAEQQEQRNENFRREVFGDKVM